MDEPFDIRETWEHEVAENPLVENPLVEETSTPYVGRWNELVSTTNWEKGHIIATWRKALIEADAPAASYGDEAWSRRVGGVSPQHVGRLRRVHDRFGPTRKQWAGLYWSHFQAALDWPDAEMWLEGAVQNGWSVAETRRQRWEAIGAPPELKPREEDIVQAELDEDVDLGVEAAPAEMFSPSAPAETLRESVGEVHDAEPPETADADSVAAVAPAPLANLAPLPGDLSEAFDTLKLVILRHKVSGWQEVACDDVLAALDALKQVALGPTQ
jgi:hypothetical protein